MIDGVRVLVADDDEEVRSSTAMILESVGWSVIEAEDGQAALEQLASQLIDVVVLDVRMPRRDGISVVENMSPEPPPPVILLDSAYDLDHELRARLGPRVFRYMEKPVSPEDLIEAIGDAAAFARSIRHA